LVYDSAVNRLRACRKKRKKGIVKTDSEFVLLIVDDERSVCRALTRLLDRQVRRIETATNPTEAEIILKTGLITHLICDHWFGPGQPLGIDLVPKWRKLNPSILRAVVLTGMDISKLPLTEGVDRILPKVVDPDELIKALELDKSPSLIG
jgi:DNA-binding NtrC family response regulator